MDDQHLAFGHHEGFIDWTTLEANQLRLQSNIRAELHQAGRALIPPSYKVWQSVGTVAVGCGSLSRHERHTPLLL
jgi:hypothetical protein